MIHVKNSQQESIYVQNLHHIFNLFIYKVALIVHVACPISYLSDNYNDNCSCFSEIEHCRAADNQTNDNIPAQYRSHREARLAEAGGEEEEVSVWPDPEGRGPYHADV